MKIGGLQKLTLIDYPNTIACTVFVTGCNFRCPWCYAPSLVLPERIKVMEDMGEDNFFDFLDKRKGKLEGVVICGGEPTINRGIFDFIKKIKEKEFLVKIDTNGSQSDVIKELIEKKLIDYIAMDIKTSFRDEKGNKKYDIATGIDANIEKIKESKDIILKGEVDYEFRTTVVSGIHTIKDIEEIAQDIKGAEKYFLQNFYPQDIINISQYSFESFSKEELEEFKNIAQKFVKFCQIR